MGVVDVAVVDVEGVDVERGRRRKGST